MPNGKFFIGVLLLVILALLVGGAVTYSNIKFAQEGTVQVVTKWGQLSASTRRLTAGSLRWRRAARVMKSTSSRSPRARLCALRVKTTRHYKSIFH